MAAAVTEKFVKSTSASVPTTSAPPTNNNGLTSYGYEEVVLEDHQQKVPIWVGLNCKLVSGISKSTTCHDLISSIVPSSQDPSKYVLIEKWKKVRKQQLDGFNGYIDSQQTRLNLNLDQQ